MLHAELTRRILRAYYEVHWELGCGFLEAVYCRALAVALSDGRLNFVREPAIDVMFRGRAIARFRADFIVEGCILLEVKACREVEPGHTAQLLNYLRATDIEIGLLLNFSSKADFRRLVFANARKTLRVPPRTSAAAREQIHREAAARLDAAPPRERR